MRPVNQDHLCEIERALGFTYPASFHADVREFTALCSTPGFKQSFPTATLLLSVPEISAERECMDARESLGVAGVPLPAEIVESGGRSSSTLVPFLRDEGRQWPDTYAFDLESQGPEYSVVVWSYSDPMVVQDWDGFETFATGSASLSQTIHTATPNPCAAANGGGPSRLQSASLVAAVAELGSLRGGKLIAS